MLPNIAWKDDLAAELEKEETKVDDDDIWEMTEEELEEEIYKTIK